MSGGFNTYDHESATPQRLSEIQAAIQEIDADIIGLVDTFRWDEVFSNEQLRNSFGYDYIFCIKLDDKRLQALGHNSGLTLMSRHPWLNCEAINLGTRNALKASFELNGKETVVILAYLDDLHEDVRLGQVQVIIDCIDKADNVLVMGDLNTIAANDKQYVVRELETFYADNPGIKEKLGPVIEQMQRAEVIAWFESRGFIEGGSEGGATVPSRLSPAASNRPFLRLDYCLHGPKIKIGDFSVHTTETMQRASDHFPISFTIG